MPMRLYLYLAADDTHWWVSELRTYDGSPSGEWIAYTGPFFRIPLGGTYLDDIDLSSANGKVPGRLRIDDMALTAFAPGSGPADWTGCRLAGPAEDGTATRWSHSRRPSGVSWRGWTRPRPKACFEHEASATTTGRTRWRSLVRNAPELVESFSWGGDGQLIVFVYPPAGDPLSRRRRHPPASVAGATSAARRRPPRWTPMDRCRAARLRRRSRQIRLLWTRRLSRLPRRHSPRGRSRRAAGRSVSRGSNELGHAGLVSGAVYRADRHSSRLRWRAAEVGGAPPERVAVRREGHVHRVAALADARSHASEVVGRHGGLAVVDAGAHLDRSRLPLITSTSSRRGPAVSAGSASVPRKTWSASATSPSPSTMSSRPSPSFRSPRAMPSVPGVPRRGTTCVQGQVAAAIVDASAGRVHRASRSGSPRRHRTRRPGTRRCCRRSRGSARPATSPRSHP